MRVYLNSGHHVKLDAGAVGNGLREADITLAIGKLVQGKLRALGVVVNDTLQHNELSDICADANMFSADVAVSIHCNGFGDASVSGTETFYFSGSDSGSTWADSIQSKLVAAIGTKNRGTKATTTLYFLRRVNAPAVLVEVAFITNAADAAILRDKKELIADAIVAGIMQ